MYKHILIPTDGSETADKAVDAGIEYAREAKARITLFSAVPEFQMVHPTQQPAIYQRLLQDIARHPLPARDNRSNPRVVKRKMSKFDLKRREHRQWPQPTKPFRDAICVLI